MNTTTDINTTIDNERFTLVLLHEIQPNRFQPRTTFDKVKLEELSKNIAAEGLLQPILLRSIDDGPEGIKFEIIAGERRWRAHKLLEGTTRIRSLVRDNVSNAEAMKDALIENLQRADLNPIEEANAIIALCKKTKMNQEQAGQHIGKSRAYISQITRLVRLPQNIQDLIAKGELNMWHGVALVGLDDIEDQKEITEKAIKGNWNVETTRKRCTALKDSKDPSLIAMKKAKKQKAKAKSTHADFIVMLEAESLEEMEETSKLLKEDGFKIWRGHKAIMKELAAREEAITDA